MILAFANEKEFRQKSQGYDLGIGKQTIKVDSVFGAAIKNFLKKEEIKIPLVDINYGTDPVNQLGFSPAHDTAAALKRMLESEDLPYCLRELVEEIHALCNKGFIVLEMFDLG